MAWEASLICLQVHCSHTPNFTWMTIFCLLSTLSKALVDAQGRDRFDETALLLTLRRRIVLECAFASVGDVCMLMCGCCLQYWLMQLPLCLRIWMWQMLLCQPM